MSISRCVLLFAVLLSSDSLNADIFSSPTQNDIPALITNLGDPNVQLGASRALTSLTNHSVEPLEDSLAAKSSEVRIWAAYTLGRIDHADEVAVPRLAETVSTATDPFERAAAARSLGQIATAKSAATEVAVSSLISGLSDPDDSVRRESATALGKLGPVAQKASDKLIKAFSDEPVREAASASIHAIGKGAVPKLLAALDDDTLRLDAARAMRLLDLDAARRAGVDVSSERDLTTLQLTLDDESHSDKSRIEATLQLGEIGTAAAPILIDAFTSDSESVSRAAAAAFQQVGPDAVQLLTDALKSESATVRTKAADALGAIGPAAKSSLPNLVAALSDSDRTVQHRAVMTLGEFAGTASEAIPALIKVMQNPRILEQTRSLALKVLVRDASDKQRDIVIAALEESSTDKNYGISSLAKVSLRKIQEESTSSVNSPLKK